MRSVEITLSDAEEALLAPIKEKNGWTWKRMLLAGGSLAGASLEADRAEELNQKIADLENELRSLNAN